MLCRNCGTEIADKAFICYRCGIATTEAKYQPHVAPRARWRTTSVVVVIVVALALFAWFLLHSSAVNPAASHLRHDWSLPEIEAIYSAPLPDLVFRAQTVHRALHRTNEVQGCMLLSIKTGGCPEDCAYCPQSAHYRTEVPRTELVPLEELTEAARSARDQGATRFCMGAAWRDVPDGAPFDRVLDMVRVVRGLGLEACCTLGMLTQAQADALAGAGLTAYNHNLDTSPEFYGNIITTRTYDDRLNTLQRVRQAGVTVCSGGIIGMGEDRSVRYRLLQQLATLAPHPESVPINLLVRVQGTPLADRPLEDPFELVRTIATARILMPASFVRLSAGRLLLTDEAQALCFLAGANSVFLGDRLLTTPNPGASHDAQLLERLGMRLTTSSAPVPAHVGG
jgi:biotin synthase